MGLTAIEIYKLLPKTNCGECGFPTCLAFAMQLANQKVSLEKCPHVTDETTQALEASALPPIRLVKIGAGENVIETGDETELFRHEKTFYHPTAYCFMLDDSLPDEDLKARADLARSMVFERVGQTLKLDMVGLSSTSNDPSKFANAVKIVKDTVDLPMLLKTDNPEVMEAGLKVCGDTRPLLHAATHQNYEKMASLAKDNNCPLVAFDDSGLESLAELTKKIKEAGVEDIVLDFGRKPLLETYQSLTTIRRLAIKKNFRPLGYPVMIFAQGEGEDQALDVAIGTMKYASVVAFTSLSTETFYPLITLRQNIYTDPQRPIQVKPGIYEIGEPNESSPVLLTTNFSLTYFTVSGDIESSKVPSYLLVEDSEGLSVMTAFAADKFNAELAAELIKSCGIQEKVNHKSIIIPGMVARMSGKLKEESGWEVLVGPQDSSGIPKYLRELAG